MSDRAFETIRGNDEAMEGCFHFSATARGRIIQARYGMVNGPSGRAATLALSPKAASFSRNGLFPRWSRRALVALA
jgi:hypothetical protein